MSETITLEIPEPLALQARRIAARSHRRVEDVLVEWLGLAAADPNFEHLTDEELLLLSNSEMSTEDQDELQDLVAKKREGSIDTNHHARLEELMTAYRHGLLLKARAIRAAVERGLRPPLDS